MSMKLLHELDDTHVLVKDDYTNKRTHRNIVYITEVHVQEYENDQLKRKKLMYAMQKREKEALEQHLRETRNGYCPYCYMQIPMSGVCDCGYTITKENK